MTRTDTVTDLATLYAVTVAALVARLTDTGPILVEIFGEVVCLDAFATDTDLRLAVSTLEGVDRSVVLVAPADLGVVDALNGLPGAPASWPLFECACVVDALTARPRSAV